MITVVSEGSVLMYDTGTGRNIGFENIFKPQEKYKLKISAALCCLLQLNFVQSNNYSERVCCQCASKTRTLLDCFSFVKSFLDKEESNDLVETIYESWRKTTPENETPIKQNSLD